MAWGQDPTTRVLTLRSRLGGGTLLIPGHPFLHGTHHQNMKAQQQQQRDENKDKKKKENKGIKKRKEEKKKRL